VRLLSFFDVAPDPEAAGSGRISAPKEGLEHLDWVDEESTTDPRLLAAYQAFGRATCGHHLVDDVTDEMVRLRSAKAHHCGFCQSVRRTVTLPDEVDDLMDEALDFEQSAIVTPQQKVALEILDHFIAMPCSLPQADRAKALEAFTPEQLFELMFKEVFWMSNKPMISLGTDPGEVTPGALTDFEYDSEGNFTILGARA
jgi:alkylhydroperoxidase family enzyme